MSNLVPIQQLVDALCVAFDNRPSDEAVLEILRQHPVDSASIESHLDFRDDKYTRNLVYRDGRFEVIVLCWETGQISRIHNHAGQSCWMAATEGKLQVINYRVAEGSADGGHCVIEPSSDFWMTQDSPGMVDLTEPIHSVGNPTELEQRAVSVHVYSLPYDYCMVYDLDAKLARKVSLSFDNAQSMPLA